MLLGLSFVLGSLACALAVMALVSCRRVALLLRKHSVRSLVELSTHVTEMQSSLESLSTTVRRMESKYRMRETRAKGKGLADPEDISELQGEEWRRAARKKYIMAGRPASHSG